jgi:arylsulfatase A-like enzyme
MLFTRILVMLGCFLLAVPSAFAQDKKPNIVFILIDDMGYADLGCMGSKEIRTPNIDRIAKEGVRLSNFYANAPVCTPTRAGLMTGRYQQRVGLEWALGYSAEQYRRVDGKLVRVDDMYLPGLPASPNSLAYLLRRAGYRTAVFGKWHLGFRPEYNPLRHGFDEYFGVLTGHADYYTFKYFDGTYVLRENDKEVPAKGYLTDLVSQKSVSFIERNKDQPFFLYVPHLAVHFPFQVPDMPGQKLTRENATEGTRKDYVQMLERVDKGVGAILDTLTKHKLLDNTLVVLSSDNGGYKLSDNGPLFHYKATLWEGGVRVPCLMRWPGKLAEGKTLTQSGITMDLTATFLAAAGAKVPADYQLDGIDLMPILTGKAKEQERTFFWRINRADRQQKALRHGNWKYLKDGAVEFLFDLDNDIGERHNLAYQQSERVARLRQLHTGWEREMDRSNPAILVK